MEQQVLEFLVNISKSLGNIEQQIKDLNYNLKNHTHKELLVEVDKKLCDQKEVCESRMQSVIVHPVMKWTMAIGGLTTVIGGLTAAIWALVKAVT